MLMYIYGIQKDGIDEFICKAAIEKQRQRPDLWTWERGEKRVRCMERVTWKLTLPHVKQIANGNLLYDSEDSNRGAVSTQRDGMGRRWEGGSRGRGYMYPYGWFMLKFDRKQQNSVKQSSYSKKKKKFFFNCHVNSHSDMKYLIYSSLRLRNYR